MVSTSMAVASVVTDWFLTEVWGGGGFFKGGGGKGETSSAPAEPTEPFLYQEVMGKSAKFTGTRPFQGVGK